MTAEIAIPYKPRPLQRQLHNQMRRFNVINCHRRFGKTTFALMHAIRDCVQNKKQRPRYAFVSPLLKQSKTVCWDMLQDFTRGIPGVKFNQQELRVDFAHNQGRIALAGGDMPDSMRGQRFDGVICDEYSQIPGTLWTQVLRPALTDRAPDSWAIFIGTPSGMDNNFAEIYRHAETAGDNWFAVTYRADQTGIIDEDELADAKATMSSEEYRQEFLCDWSANTKGSIFGADLQEAETDGRICSVPWDRAAEVHIGVDLGISDTFTIWWFQEVGREIHFIDYYENTGQALDHYVKIIKDKPYTYGRYLFPHDVEARELGTGVSRSDTLRNLGIPVTVMPRTSMEDRISACRMAFQRLYFDQKKCAEGLRALRAWKYDYNEKMRVLKPKPQHSWASHAADSFGLCLEGVRFARPAAALRKPDQSWIV